MEQKGPSTWVHVKRYNPKTLACEYSHLSKVDVNTTLEQVLETNVGFRYPVYDGHYSVRMDRTGWKLEADTPWNEPKMMPEETIQACHDRLHLDSLLQKLVIVLHICPEIET